MNPEVLLELEKKVGEAIRLIADLRKEKENLERENSSLKQQLKDQIKRIEEFEKDLKKTPDAASIFSESEGREIKKRLQKLAGKLAALEDSWN